jgi:hypothetical protein
MRALPLVGCIVLTAASTLAAQVRSAEQQIAGAVTAAPEAMRKDATVLGYSNYHRMTVLRQGSGEMVCIADDPSAASWHVACYHRDLEPFMAMGRQLEAEGKTSQQIKEARREAIKAGTLKMPEGPHALYNLYAPADSIDPKTGIGKSPQTLRVVYIPYATEETTGLPVKPEHGMPWIMAAGEPWAHIMIMKDEGQ